MSWTSSSTDLDMNSWEGLDKLSFSDLSEEIADRRIEIS